MTSPYNFFVTVARRMEQPLAAELRSLGAREVQELRSGVMVTGPLELGLRICLWSRLASRVLLPLAEFDARSNEELYEGVRAVNWQEHMQVDNTLAVDCNLAASRITHSHYAALKVKDAIVDQFRDNCGSRPSVRMGQPDIRLNLHLHRDRAVLSLDLSGDSLHRRGYRQEGQMAPLKETLAAAILLQSGWPGLAAEGRAMLDPMCGSGTLCIEAALMAADTAPGLLREHFGFVAWQRHDPALWQQLLDEAEERRRQGMERLPAIIGYDIDKVAVKAALANTARAGLEKRLHFEVRPLAELGEIRRTKITPGLLVVNPPYGERIGEPRELRELYRELGNQIRQLDGWRAVVFTGSPELAGKIGLRPLRSHVLYNGPIRCQVLLFGDRRAAAVKPAAKVGQPAAALAVPMLANRLRKNLKSVRDWARRQNIDCFRIYDSDIPEYAAAVDIYEEWAHVQEYAPPASVEATRAALRFQEVLATVAEVMEMDGSHIFAKRRQRQSGKAQYAKLDSTARFYKVGEGGAHFWVNFIDYLDTGLFLDHRPTRALIQSLAAGRRFLNLFGYTGSATVYAAMGGATASTTVDMSATYIDWARRNFELNNLNADRHLLVQADCLEWLQQAKESYDLIFLDPPTFSNSKRMNRTLDVQRDHCELLQMVVRLLSDHGILLFANNRRGFKMAPDILPGYEIRNITRQTIPRDFARNPQIHNCWHISRKNG